MGGGGGGGGFFFQQNPSLKKKCFLFEAMKVRENWGVGVGGGVPGEVEKRVAAYVNFFCKRIPILIKKKLFFGWGWGEGARVSDFS